MGELSINVSLSSDLDTRHFRSPPSSLCHIVNPAVPPASRGPARRTARLDQNTERERTRRDRERKKVMKRLCSNLIRSTRFDGIYVDAGESISLHAAFRISVSKSLQ